MENIDNDLPSRITRIDVLRVERGMKKLCQCLNPHYKIDTTNRLVYCTDCGAIVDPYDAFLDITIHCERLENQANKILEETQQLRNYKPWLRAIKELESNYRKHRYPVCPHCSKGIDLQDIVVYTQLPCKNRQEF